MANKIYHAVEGLITFTDTTGSAAITLNNLAATTGGRLSARYDRGTGSKPGLARIWGTFQMATNGVIGETIEVYVIAWSSHGTPQGAGAVGTADAALTADQARNLGLPALIVQVDKTDTNTDIRGSAIIEVIGRYVSVAVLNKTADNLRASNDTNVVSLEFLPLEIQ